MMSTPVPATLDKTTSPILSGALTVISFKALTQSKILPFGMSEAVFTFAIGKILLSVVMLVMIWKRMLPLKNTAQRILASFCNPIVFTGIVGNLFTLLPWPLDQIDHGTESAGHLLVLILGLVLLREKAKCVECKEAVQ